MVRPATLAVATSSTGRSRTVTVELLLMRSSFLCVKNARIETGNVTHKAVLEATLLYCPAPCPARAETATTDAHPGGQAKWVKSPHGRATVSGERFARSHQPRARVDRDGHWTLRLGRQRTRATSASQETWPPRASYPRRARRR